MPSTIRIVVVGAALLAAVPAAAQSVVMRPVPAPASAVDNYIHTVGDLDRTFVFYRDVIGLPVMAEPGETVSEPRLQRLTNTPGASLRTARFRLPGTGAGLLLTEFSGVDRRPQHPRRSDPGASTLVVTVRDLDAMLRAARAFGAPVVTAGGVPLALGPGTRAIVLTDPDGFYVEIVETDPVPETDAPARSRVVLARVAFTVEDAEPVLSFYRDVLGFRADRFGRFAPDDTVGRLVGIEGGEVRATIAQIPGSPLEWEFVEFRGVERTAHLGRLQDPGVPAISVLVPDVRVAARAVREAGLPIVSAGERPAMSDAGGAVFVRDPGGILLELIERR